jgi:hypothetical protein
MKSLGHQHLMPRPISSCCWHAPHRPPKSSGSVVGAGYTTEAYRKLKTKVDKYDRTNNRVKAAIASYRCLSLPAQQDICGYVDRYLGERSATLAAAFKMHAKLHVSVNFNTCCGGNKAMNGDNYPGCLFREIDSIFKVVMTHVVSEAVEDETEAVAGKLDIEHMVDLVPSVNVLLALVCRNFETSHPKNYQEFHNRTSEVTIDAFLNHIHRPGHSVMCGPGIFSTFTCAADHSRLELAGPATRILQYNTEHTLQYPDSQSGLLNELKHENKVLSDLWNAMLAEFNPVPTYGFKLPLDDAKAKNAAARTAAARTATA